MTLWGGRDPLVRWLRVVAVVAFLALLGVIVLDPIRGNDLPLVALLSGAVLLQLGYEVSVPFISKPRKDEHDDDRAA
jgi:hypothetical protein